MHALCAGEVQSFVTLWTKICGWSENRAFAVGQSAEWSRETDFWPPICGKSGRCLCRALLKYHSGVSTGGAGALRPGTVR
jgi:hypothetical protein